jgi:hypothetical protein
MRFAKLALIFDKYIGRIIRMMVNKIPMNSPPSMAEEDKKTSFNIRYTLRRSSGLAYEKPQSSLRSFVGFFSGTFLCPWKPTVSLFGAQNVVQLSRYTK